MLRMIEEPECSKVIKSLSRIFLQSRNSCTQIKKCHWNDFGFNHFPSEWIAFIHCIVCQNGIGIALARDICSLSTPNNRFLVGSSRSQCYIFRMEKSIESTIVCML